MSGNPSLGDLVKRAQKRRGDVSVRELERQAEIQGFRIVATTMNQMASGKYKSRPSDPTLRAIAWLAEVDLKTAYAAAERPQPGPPFADELPPGVDTLSPKKRKAVIELLRVLIDEDEEGGLDAADAGDALEPSWEPGIAALDERAPSTGERKRRRQDDDAERNGA